MPLATGSARFAMTIGIVRVSRWTATAAAVVDKLTLTMLGAFAEFERAKIIERTTRGRLHRLRMGEMSSNGHTIAEREKTTTTGHRSNAAGTPSSPRISLRARSSR
jgi:hypothetical protein